MLIDVTQVGKLGMSYIKGAPTLKVEKVKCFEGTEKEYATTFFSGAVHNSGTHIDTMSVIEIELDRLIRKGIKFDVSHIENRPIELRDLDLSMIEEGIYVFFQTNWDRYLDNEKRYQDHPEVSIEVINYLIDKKVNMVGIDALGFGRGKNHRFIDNLFANNNIYGIENLTNLSKIPKKDFKVYCMPIKIEKLDALPTRILVEF